MADGGIWKPPFGHIAQLVNWGFAHADYLEGRWAASGIDPLGKPAKLFLNILYAAVVDDVDGMVDRYEVRKKLDEALAKAQAKLDPEEWGTSEEARSDMQRMMSLAGKME